MILIQRDFVKQWHLQTGFQYFILLRLEKIYKYNYILQVGNNPILVKLYIRKLYITILICKIGQLTRFL